jgi:ATP-dependent helicase/nuclease subunit A
MLKDSQQRHQATDPRQSYIVQAPAGSGKTEILSQRFLRLLGTVSAPEQIIALTFTRKAANEMRERILSSLQDAHAGIQARSEHQAQTLSYAKLALQRDNDCQWNLLEQPQRLRVLTIDALCQSLSQAIPLQEKQIPYANISDHPQAHYQQAAHDCLQFALNDRHYQPAIKTLLAHLDNRQDLLLSLWEDLLAQREQWLQLLYSAKNQEQSRYEEALALIIKHELQRLQQSIPVPLAEELVRCARELADIDHLPQSPRSPLKDWKDFADIDSKRAQALASLLLNSTLSLRKSFDHHVGLKRGLCDDACYDALKTASKALLQELEDHTDFLPALLRVRKLPQAKYDAEQWAVLQALFILLPLLVAHLQLSFQKHNEVDFAAIAAQALMALGDDEQPTDLALYLDYSIQHLLVDEFQDTSLQQFHLLSKLVHAWQNDEGKTLFLVGDPMQSIYRFRAAEVGLFLRAQQQGIGPIQLIPLKLSCNFRSSPRIVDWVNQQFKSIFPQQDDIELGAIAYHPSAPMQSEDDDSKIIALQCETIEEEAQILVQQLQEELQHHPEQSIAILVRSRRQLRHIVRVLREQQLPFQGVDIDLLAHLPHLRDLWTLTQAFLRPGNRLHWLALLRSPYGGLRLDDLHCLAQHAPERSILYALSQWETIQGLSDEGKVRARYLHSVFDLAFAERYQQTLIASLLRLLQALHYEKILSSAEQDDIEQYWQLLERFEADGQIADFKKFNDAFNALYSQRTVPSSLQIMTIHKAKGLEFDTVILPGLSSKPNAVSQHLMRYLQLPRRQDGELLLVSPMKAAHHEHCLLYNYLGRLDAEKSAYESQRLLYVAVTRAKKRLYLMDYSEKQTQGSFRQLLSRQDFTCLKKPVVSITSSSTAPMLLYALPQEHYQTVKDNSLSSGQNAPIMTLDSQPRLLGVVAHELLQWMANHHVKTIDDVPWPLAQHHFLSLGLSSNDFDGLMHDLKQQIHGFLQDSRGQWLMHPHDDEHNEYELLVNAEQGPVTQIIDRSFRADGIQWIIDFKTGQESQTAETAHRQQVNGYAALFAQQNAEQIIHCGLYYLQSNQWIAWEYEHHAS